SVLHPPAWQRFPHAFTHIFAGGYAAGYYSYLWAEVLSADAFARFADAGVIDPATGAAFRQAILARGATRPALENFIAFRGREPDARALLKSYGLDTDRARVSGRSSDKRLRSAGCRVAGKSGPQQ